MVVEDMVKRLNLTNIEVRRGRVEELPRKKTFDFVIGRAVTALPTFFGWVQDKIAKGQKTRPQMVFYLKEETTPKN